ncbi:peptidylprolyl isomerase [Sorangium sp. So ce119]|uniref:peptidylprolyl isomerase n=1 Tax=Sorangium sp. So ce119 TaxID=3133279 RepID=UPI003F605021
MGLDVSEAFGFAAPPARARSMPEPSGRTERGFARLLREPVIHFLFIGALLFLAHRLIAGDPRVVVVGAGLTADLERQFRDQTGRAPTEAELKAALDRWKQEEVLYREALREGLDQQDATVRTVLADKLRARAAQQMAARRPTDAELDAWFASHRSRYETPLRYDFHVVAFPRSDPAAEQQRSTYRLALADGADPRTLGRPIVGGNLTRDELAARFGSAVSETIGKSPLAAWQALETDDSLLLVRVNGTSGGLPSREEIRPILTADWVAAMKKQAADEFVESVLARYRFEKTP